MSISSPRGSLEPFAPPPPLPVPRKLRQTKLSTVGGPGMSNFILPAPPPASFQHPPSSSTIDSPSMSSTESPRTSELPRTSTIDTISEDKAESPNELLKRKWLGAGKRAVSSTTRSRPFDSNFFKHNNRKFTPKRVFVEGPPRFTLGMKNDAANWLNRPFVSRLVPPPPITRIGRLSATFFLDDEDGPSIWCTLSSDVQKFANERIPKYLEFIKNNGWRRSRLQSTGFPVYRNLLHSKAKEWELGNGVSTTKQQNGHFSSSSSSCSSSFSCSHLTGEMRPQSAGRPLARAVTGRGGSFRGSGGGFGNRPPYDSLHPTIFDVGSFQVYEEDL